ncbi:DUF420 domain-containing protein [bacterium]|nr:DUF420 domain-containing protein [bacterium]
MIPGFLPFSRATIMFDVVAVALIAFLPALAFSIALVKRGHYLLHKRIQVALGVILLITVVLFEVDVQMSKLVVEGGWRTLTVESPYHGKPIDNLLRIHLVFATMTALLWIVTIVQALMNFPKIPVPGPYSRNHKMLGWASTVGMFITCTTGWTFYYMAFVATKTP